MLFMSNPSLAYPALYGMRVLPRLNIDRILLLSVLLSVVYLILYGSQHFEEKSSASRTPHGVHPGEAFLGGAYEKGKGQRQGQASFIKDVQYPDILSSTADGSSARLCPSRVRVKALSERCQQSPARNSKYGGTERQHLRYVVLDHERKLFYCLIGKAGSKSWLQYLIDSKNSNERGHLRHNDFLKKVGLEMYRNMPLDMVDKQYKDFYKFLVVRHPLQRVVSAYYETVILHNKYKNKNGKLLNLTEFAEGITTDMLDLNPHWRRYINRCQVCKVEYQYIVKTETMDDDIKGFNKIIGNEPTTTVKLTHQNQLVDEDELETDNSSHHYKYDKMLYDLQRRRPDLMAKLLNVYGEDMRLFGYRWDWFRGKSSCGATYDGHECC